MDADSAQHQEPAAGFMPARRDELQALERMVATLNEHISELYAILREPSELPELPELEYIELPEYVPEVTISHDRLATGAWRYKTSVTMPMPLPPEGAPAGSVPRDVVRALQLADHMAREESQRRVMEDGAERQQG